MARLDQQLGIRAHERHGHRDLDAVGQQEVRSTVELLDDAEDVVPTTRVQASRVIPKLVQNFVHLEGGRHDFEQHGGLDGPARNAESVLGHLENVVPQTRLTVALELGQVKVRPTAALDQSARVVEEIQTEVEEGASDRAAVHQDVFFGQVPAAWPHEQGRRLVVQTVGSAIRVLERNRALDGVDQIDLAVDHVLPRWRVGVLEVGHVHVGARVEGVDQHLAIGRAGQLNPAPLQVGVRYWGDFPVAVAGLAGLGQEVGQLARLQPYLAFTASFEQGLASRVELALEPRDELECSWGQHVVEAG